MARKHARRAGSLGKGGSKRGAGSSRIRSGSRISSTPAKVKKPVSRIAAQLRRAQAEIARLQKQLKEVKRRPAPNRERPVTKRSKATTSRPRITRLPEPSAQVFRPDIEGRVNSALRRMRAGESITAAARAEGLDVRTLRRNAGDEIYETRSGEVRARRGITRTMPFLDADGQRKILRIRGGKNISLNAEYWAELQAAFKNGQITEFEARWRGTKINGREVLADATKLRDLADQGELKFEGLVMSSRARSAGGAR